jgi:hypothetical protein
MALPQQVVEQLNQGSRRTPGWSSGILLFSGSILFIILLVYAGLQFGYEPYLNAQLSSFDSQVQKLGQSISASDQANLVTFYSQINNLQSLIKNHVFFSQFLTWLEQHTEANVYYTNMVFSSGAQVALVGIAGNAADVSEQIAAFEAAPEVAAVSLSNVAYSSSVNGWIFNVVLTMHPSVFAWSSGSAPAAAAPVSGPAATTSTTP